jgi:HK97 family phage major capsid protein
METTKIHRPIVSDSFASFLKTVVQVGQGNGSGKALNLARDSEGGFLVPADLAREIRLVSNSFSVVRSRATQFDMEGDRKQIPSFYDSDHSSSEIFGGIAMKWLPEGTSMTAIDATVGQNLLQSKKLAGYVYVSDELLEDSPMMTQLLTVLFGKAAAWYEDKAFINGSGVGEPLGILQSGALIRPNRSAANTIAIADLANMFTRLLPGSHNSPSLVFLASPTTLAQLIQLGGSAISFGDYGARLMGLPIFFTDICPALGSVGDIILADLFYYVIGDRHRMAVKSAKTPRFLTDETSFLITERIDGQPWVDSTFTPLNGSSSLSPFVTLYSATEGGD